MLRVLGTRVLSQRPTVILSQNFASSEGGKPTQPQAQGSSIPNVPGFSEAVLRVPNEPVGYAGAAKDKEYKCPEYFCYHVDSYADTFVELEKYRLETPSNKVPFKK